MKIEDIPITKLLKASFKALDDFDYKKELLKKRKNQLRSYLNNFSSKIKK